MFADTDFLLALVKETDWLKKNAEKIFGKYKGEVKASASVMIELAIVCKRFKLDVVDTFTSVLEFVEIRDEETYKICLDAALYVEDDRLNVFDAFHAAYCGSDSIISSDSDYEKVGINRIRLEEA